MGAAIKYQNGTNSSDTIIGSQCWCPITNLEAANMAYEWNIGRYFTTNTRELGTFTRKLSDYLALNYINYINDLKLKDENENYLNFSILIILY